MEILAVVSKVDSRQDDFPVACIDQVPDFLDCVFLPSRFQPSSCIGMMQNVQ